VRLVVIGDIHLFAEKIRPRQLLGKRLLGHGNLLINRRHRFNHAMLPAIIERVRGVNPDLALFSGDVTTTSLADEFEDVVRYIKPLSDEVDVLLVPGNHDRYTFRSQRKRRIETVLKGLMPEAFPHLEPLGETWRVIALDSARPQVVMSRGGLGKAQRAGLVRLLEGLTEDHGLIVLCHYPADLPPGIPRSWAHDMAEAKVVRHDLAACPARVLFVHGHIHKPWYWAPGGDKGPAFECLNAGSPCLVGADYPLGQGFWELTLPETAGGNLGLVHHVPLLPPDQVAAKPRRRRRPVAVEPRWVPRPVTPGPGLRL